MKRKIITEIVYTNEPVNIGRELLSLILDLISKEDQQRGSAIEKILKRRHGSEQDLLAVLSVNM